MIYLILPLGIVFHRNASLYLALVVPAKLNFVVNSHLTINRGKYYRPRIYWCFLTISDFGACSLLMQALRAMLNKAL